MTRPFVVAVALFAGAHANPQHAPAADADRIRAAIDWVRRAEPATLADQARLCEIAAPPSGESARAAAVRGMLQSAGLKNVYLDDAGNVVAERRGRFARPHVVFAAHLDTVFPEGTHVRVSREGARWRGPGIADNCRGLAVLVAVARALEHAGVQTQGSVTFAATVGEEGLGNLRGVRELVGRTLQGRVDRFVALDGAGYAITTVGVGSRRYRVTFRGPGGHSYHDFGRHSAVQALGRAVALIADLKVPSSPKTTFNIGRIGGGVAVNSIPGEAWMEIDLRSVDGASLESLDRHIHEAIDRALAAEEKRASGNRRATVEWERIGDRPAGRVDAGAGIVRAALSISNALGVAGRLVEGSTDANIPMAWSIPAIAVGAGGGAGGVHSTEEWFNTTDSVRGTERALLLAVALSRGKITLSYPY